MSKRLREEENSNMQIGAETTPPEAFVFAVSAQDVPVPESDDDLDELYLPSAISGDPRPPFPESVDGPLDAAGLPISAN